MTLDEALFECLIKIKAIQAPAPSDICVWVAQSDATHVWIYYETKDRRITSHAVPLEWLVHYLNN